MERVTEAKVIGKEADPLTVLQNHILWLNPGLRHKGVVSQLMCQGRVSHLIGAVPVANQKGLGDANKDTV